MGGGRETIERKGDGDVKPWKIQKTRLWYLELTIVRSRTPSMYHRPCQMSSNGYFEISFQPFGIGISGSVRLRIRRQSVV